MVQEGEGPQAEGFYPRHHSTWVHLGGAPPSPAYLCPLDTEIQGGDGDTCPSSPRGPLWCLLWLGEGRAGTVDAFSDRAAWLELKALRRRCVFCPGREPFQGSCWGLKYFLITQDRKCSRTREGIHHLNECSHCLHGANTSHSEVLPARHALAAKSMHVATESSQKRLPL